MPSFPKLDTPDDLAYATETGILTWTGDENAETYAIYVDGTAEYATADNTASFDLGAELTTAGTYDIQVKAISADDDEYNDSDLSTALEVTIAET